MRTLGKAPIAGPEVKRLYGRFSSPIRTETAAATTVTPMAGWNLKSQEEVRSMFRNGSERWFQMYGPQTLPDAPAMEYAVYASGLTLHFGSSLSVSSCGINIEDASAGSDGTSQRNKTVAEKAPSNWVMIKPGASAGLIPAKVFVTDRASVTAGFANEVDAVNQ